jgi:hypothetical protein
MLAYAAAGEERSRRFGRSDVEARHRLRTAAAPESQPRKSGRENRWSFCLTAGTLWLSNQEIR